MLILIDGYNVLKSVVTTGYVDDIVRNKFLDKLVRYQKKTSHKIIIVFDGGLDAYPVKEHISEVLVVYSGKRLSADELIKRYLIEYKNQDLLLVSTDRELDYFGNNLGVDYMDSEEFYTRMNDRLSGFQSELENYPDNVLHKISEKNYELDRLMEEASCAIMIKEEDRKIPERIRHKESALTKAERHRLKKILKI